MQLPPNKGSALSEIQRTSKAEVIDLEVRNVARR